MTRREYLDELWGRLSAQLPRQELDNVIHYYEEYFDEAGSENEAGVIEELGTPEELARQIAADRAGKTGGAGAADYGPGGGRRSGGRIALLICLFPLWIALFAVAFALTVTLTVGLLAVAAALAISGGMCVAAGIFTGLCAFSALFTPGIPTMLFVAGEGLISMGLGCLLLLAFGALGRVCGRGALGLWKCFVGGVGRFWRWAVGPKCDVEATVV